MRSSMRDAFTAAEMAVEYINSREDLLPSVTLEMLIDTTDELLPTFSSASQGRKQSCRTVDYKGHEHKLTL